MRRPAHVQDGRVLFRGPVYLRLCPYPTGAYADSRWRPVQRVSQLDQLPTPATGRQVPNSSRTNRVILFRGPRPMCWIHTSSKG